MSNLEFEEDEKLNSVTDILIRRKKKLIANRQP